MDVASDVVLAGDGVASRGEDSAGGDAAANQSPSTDVDDSTEEDFRADASVDERQVEPSDSSFQYVYLAYPSLPGGTGQVVAFATPDDGDTIASAKLNYVSANGVQGTIEASATADNSAAFIFGSQLESNTYFLTSITYALQGDGSEHEVDLSDRDYSFTVVDGSVSSEGTSVYYADGDGNAVEAQSIQQALECADSPDGISTYAERSARNVGVIALDAGHGGVDSGAQGNGKSEADLTWKIMTACKNKLEAYGFKIVLARQQSGYYPSNDYLYRVQRCIDQGAQAFVSFHINSGPSGAHGAEVYAPTANDADYTQVSVELANKVMNNLAAMGLTYRGVFQMEVGDEFAVIRCAREQGIPGILIEHGFISNYGDVANYFSDDGCRRLGEADAAAIIAQFPHPYSVNGITFSEELGCTGSTVKIGVSVSGKTDGLRYKFVWHRAGSDWSDSNWGVIGQDLTSSSISWTLPQAGEYEIYADVIDSNGYVTSTSKYKVVNWSLESLEVSGPALCGKPAKLQAKVSGDASRLWDEFPECCTLPHIVNFVMKADTGQLQEFLKLNDISAMMAGAYLKAEGSEKTQASYVSTLSNYVAKLATNENICYVLTGNDFDFNLIDPEHPKLFAISNNYATESVISPVIAMVMSIDIISAGTINQQTTGFQSRPYIR